MLRRASLLKSSVIACACIVAPLSAQIDRDAFRERLRQELRGGLAHYASAVIGLTSIPDLAAARYDVDSGEGAEVDTIKLPFEFDLHALEAGGALFFEGSLGYLRAKTVIDDIVGTPSLATRVDARTEVWDATVGLGLRLAIAEGLSLSPIVDVGVSRIESNARYSGPGAALVRSLLDGIAFNWSATSLDVAVGLRADYKVRIEPGLEIELSTRWSHEHSFALKSTDEAQDFDVTSHFVTSKAQLAGPTGWEPFEEPLRWKAHLAHNWLPGDSGEALGFRYYWDLGLGLEWGIGELGLPVDSMRLTVSRFVGPDLEGWSFGVGFSLNL